MDSYDEILERMKTTYKNLSNSIINDDSDLGIRMKVLAGEVFSLQNNAEWLKNQMFAQTAVEDQLDKLALERGITRKTAIKSTGKLTFSRTTALNYDIEIAEGTVCSTVGVNSIRVKTTEMVILSAGELSVTASAESEEGGSAQNTAINTVTVLVTPPAGITSVTNNVAFTGGSDAETDSELRERVIDSYKNISNGTNCAFYKEQALKYDGIYSASAVAKARGTGTVDIYVSGRGSLPSDELIEQIQTGINKLREVNVDVQVNKAIQIGVAVAVSIKVKTSYSFDEIKTQCINNINEYFNSLKIGDPFLVAAIGNIVYEINGVENYTISSICIDRYMTSSQVAVPYSIQISEA